MGSEQFLDRIRVLRPGRNVKGPILYWMSRDQRATHNHALLYAQDIAVEQKVPLVVVFCMVPEFMGATIRQYSFMIDGLHETSGRLAEKNISLVVLTGDPVKKLPEFIRQHKISVLVTDFDPLRIKRKWVTEVSHSIDIPHNEVDAHNIVPCWVASDKQEYGAYTIRPKIHRLLDRFLVRFPSLKKNRHSYDIPADSVDWDKIRESVRVDRKVKTVEWLKPGTGAAEKILKEFPKHKLSGYSINRNDPNLDAQSNLSPYLHFGQISAQDVALVVSKADAPVEDKDAFLEELIVRRELSDNFCYYNHNYDSIKGIPEWAAATHRTHRRDEREYIYSLKNFEKAKTHEGLWNAAQLEMVKSGKMHGYMRMYWAKKILEWSESPEEAIRIAIHLNDKYELDGRDPNGYTGVMWSVGGVHDRPWTERPVFGKIRYMNENGARRKFDVDEYIEKWTG